MNDSKESKGTPRLASTLAAELRQLMNGVPIGTKFVVPDSADICDSLELFLPGTLRDHYPIWTKESIDGFFFAHVKKTGPHAAELAGTCILISDQTVTPFLVNLELAPSEDSITAYDVRLGEPGGGLLGISGPSCNSKEASHFLKGLPHRLTDVPWVYHVTKSHGDPGAMGGRSEA